MLINNFPIYDANFGNGVMYQGDTSRRLITVTSNGAVGNNLKTNCCRGKASSLLKLIKDLKNAKAKQKKVK